MMMIYKNSVLAGEVHLSCDATSLYSTDM